jgi:hypothetical protein
MTITRSLLLSLSILLTSSLAFTTLPQRVSLTPQCHQRKNTRRPTTKIHKSELRYSWEEDSAGAQPLPYSPKDLDRLAELKTREITVPIVILDSILPGQKLHFQRYVRKNTIPIDDSGRKRQTDRVGRNRIEMNHRSCSLHDAAPHLSLFSDPQL